MKLVTAIMPTRGRAEWAAQAVECFKAQTYPHKNLIIIDDQDEPSFPGWTNETDMLRIAMDDRKGIAEKRNIGVQAATGELVWHLDSDDWSDPERMTKQVAIFEWAGKAVVGYHSMLFHEPSTGRWRKYVGYSNYGLGTSLLYRREWALLRPFCGMTTDSKSKLLVSEDGEFVKKASSACEYYGVDAEKMMVAHVHSDNSSHKSIDQLNAEGGYRGINPSMIPENYQWL